MERLNEKEKQELLIIARETLKRYYEKGEIPKFEIKNERLKELKLGCFVTLKKHGHLRGCLGNFSSREPLYVNVQKMAIASSKEDPRFEPVKNRELNEIEIEISVLYPLIEVNNFDEIQVGRDGLYIEYGFFRGVLLPQVATEYGWDRDEFLSHTCLKSGLPQDAWKRLNLKVYRFEADVFSEKDLK
jgi:AmmeMemoRadiSam system protein A